MMRLALCREILHLQLPFLTEPQLNALPTVIQSDHWMLSEENDGGLDWSNHSMP